MSGYFYIKSQLNGLVMDVEGGGTSPGSRVVMWDYKSDDNDNQLFYEDHATSTIRSKASQLCLEVQGIYEFRKKMPLYFPLISIR